MKTQRARTQPGKAIGHHPIWMRLLAFACMALLAVASTVQVCHSHDVQAGQGAIASFDFATSHDLAESLDPPSPLPDATSSVNCPLCVAMHSALPVTQRLATFEIVQVTQRAIAVQTAKRLFLWRFHLASRPPPAAGFFA